MKLSNYTLIFVILFGALIISSELKGRIITRDYERQLKIEAVCSEGVKNAAREFADCLLEKEYYGKEFESEAISDSFFSAASAGLGKPGILAGKTEKALAPIMCLIYEDGLEIISQTLAADGSLGLKSKGKKEFGRSDSMKKLLISALEDERTKVIGLIEQELNIALNEQLTLRGIKLDSLVDLPEESCDFVESIYHPAVIIISFVPYVMKRGYSINLHGAEISEEYYYSIENMGRRELHTETCEKFKNEIENGSFNERFESYKAAVLAGLYPSACCDPLGACVYDNLSY